MSDTSISSITPIQGGITVFGNKRICIADIVMTPTTDVWPAAGIALTPSQLGMSGLDTVLICGGAKANYNWSANVLQAYISTVAGSAMVSASGIALGETIRVVAIGYGLA